MDPKGYYALLGIAEDATTTQIKDAYRKVALNYHPDRNKSAIANELMKRINEAYETLSDPIKRKDYDNIKENVVFTKSPPHRPPWWYYFFGEYDEDYEDEYRTNQRDPQAQYTSYTYSNTNKRDYKDKRVGIIGQMIGSLIPLINFWIFGRIERLEMAFSCLFPILIGLIVFMATLPEFPYFLLTYEDRFYLFIMLFGSSLVFFARRWSLQWNKQIDGDQTPSGDEIDKKVGLITQMILSVIPFLNFTAFARIYHFRRAVVIGIPTYILMAVLSKWISQDSSYVFYSAFLTLTSVVFMYFMYRWTTRYNAGKCNRWGDTWRDL